MHLGGEKQCESDMSCERKQHTNLVVLTCMSRSLDLESDQDLRPLQLPPAIYVVVLHTLSV